MNRIRLDQRDIHDETGAASSPRVYFLGILALALLLRVVMALAMAQGDPNLWFYNQASELGCLAHALNTGYGFASPFCGVTGPSAFLAPGYPLLVAFVFRIFGEFSRESTIVLVAFQLLFGLLIIVVVMLLTRRLFGAQAANIAGTLCTISPTLIWLPVLFWETSLSILFLVSALTLALHCIDASKLSNWAAMGLLCALAMLINPALTLTLAAIFAWMTWQNRAAKGSPKGPLLTAVLWALLFAPWPIRNQIVLHAFIPLRSNLGYELWQGNHPGSDGAFSPELHLNVNRVERSRYAQIGEVAYMREKSALAVAAIKADPTSFMLRSIQRFIRFWIGTKPEKNSAIIVVALSLTAALGFAGLVMLMRQRLSQAILLALPFLVFPLPYYLTHADFRFRLLLDPIAIMLATYAMQCWHRRFSKRRVASMLEATAITATSAPA